MTPSARPIEFWGRLYVLTAALLCAPSYAAWFRPSFNLGAAEFDPWLGLLPMRWPGQLWHAVLFLALGLIFLRLVEARDELPKRYRVAAWAVFLAAVPWMSPDVGYYLAKGWMESHYAASPYTTTIAQIPAFESDPILNAVVPPLRQMPGNYGALFQQLSAGVAALSGGQPMLGVLLFKLLGAMALAACCVLVDSLSRLLPDSTPLASRWIALNPLVLFNFLATAHNDVHLMVLVLAAAWAAMTNRWLVAGAAIGVGMAFKIAPVFILPAFAILAWRTGGVPMAIRAGVAFVSGMVAGVGGSVLVDPRSADFLLSVAGNAFGGARTSIHLVLHPLFVRWHFPWGLDSLLLGKALFLVTGAVLISGDIVKRAETPRVAFITSCFELFVLAQLLVMPNMAEWYLFWPLCFAVVLGRAHALQWCGRVSAFFMPLAIWHVVGLVSVVLLTQSILLGVLCMAHFGYFARKLQWIRDP